MEGKNTEKEREALVWPALAGVGTLIILASIVSGVSACVLIWEITIPSLGWHFASSNARMTFGIWFAAIVLGALVNMGFGFLLLAVGEIRDEIKKISTGKRPTQIQEDQAGDGLSS